MIALRGRTLEAPEFHQPLSFGSTKLPAPDLAYQKDAISSKHHYTFITENRYIILRYIASEAKQHFTTQTSQDKASCPIHYIIDYHIQLVV